MFYKVLDIGPNGGLFKIQTEGQPSLWCKVEPNNTAIKEIAKNLKVGNTIKCSFIKRNGYASFTNLELAGEVVAIPPVQAIQPQLQTIVEATKTIKETEMVQKPTVGTGNNFANTGFTCSKCGAPMKDDKYKTCYTCSMAAKAAGGTTTTATKTWGKTPDEQNSIKRQAIMHAVSRTIIGLQGSSLIQGKAQLMETIEELYAKYQDLVG